VLYTGSPDFKCPVIITFLCDVFMFTKVMTLCAVAAFALSAGLANATPDSTKQPSAPTTKKECPKGADCEKTQTEKSQTYDATKDEAASLDAPAKSAKDSKTPTDGSVKDSKNAAKDSKNSKKDGQESNKDVKDPEAKN